MNSEKGLLIDGKIYKLADCFKNREKAFELACFLEENCYTTVKQMKDGAWGVYWRPFTGILCPYGVV